MTEVLLDTHAWTWTLVRTSPLSHAARQAIEDADIIYISPISLYEVGQKVRIGKWPEMKSLLTRLTGLVDEQGGRYAPLTPTICLEAATIDWEHRDPFDRILAQTAMAMQIPIISADIAFDDLLGRSNWRGRIW